MPVLSAKKANFPRISLLCLAMITCVTSGCTLQDHASTVIGNLSSARPASGGQSKTVELITLQPTSVKVAGPKGYCIDPKTVQQDEQGSFVLLASCHSLTGRAPKSFAPAAILTIAMAPSDTPITTDAVRELATGGSTAKIIKHHTSAQTPVFQLESGLEHPIGGAQNRHWRGAMALNDQLVAISAYVPRSSHGTAVSGKSLILKTATILKDLNPDQAVSPAQRPSEKKGLMRPKLRPTPQPNLLVSLRPQLRP
jgi:hypothetical protein